MTLKFFEKTFMHTYYFISFTELSSSRPAPFSVFVFLFVFSGESLSLDAQPIDMALGKDGLAVIVCLKETVVLTHTVLIFLIFTLWPLV